MIEEQKTTLERLTGGTHARVDLDAYARNIERLKLLIPRGTRVMAVVKADGYGHGAIECGRAATESGVAMLGVARIAEGLALRRAGLNVDILVLGPPNLAEVALALQDNIILSVGSEDSVRMLNRGTVGSGRLRVHLKVDTGMRRFGVLPERTNRVVKTILGNQSLELDGIFTHFSSADEAHGGPTEVQIERFARVVDMLRTDSTLPRWIHLANSAGVLSGRLGDGNLIRCGIASYGLSPSVDVPVPGDFEPVMTIHSRVGRRFRLRAEESVSYGLTYRADADEEMATIPVGYADGLSRDLSNSGWFTREGQHLPIRGRICMDQTIVGNANNVVEGDEITIMGSGIGDMTFDAAAARTGTINYELATRITARVPRIYYRHGYPAAWDHVLIGERGTFG